MRTNRRDDYGIRGIAAGCQLEVLSRGLSILDLDHDCFVLVSDEPRDQLIPSGGNVRNVIVAVHVGGRAVGSTFYLNRRTGQCFAGLLVSNFPLNGTGREDREDVENS